MVSTLETRTSERILLLRRIFRSSKISTIVRRYFREYPHVEGDPDAFIRNIPKGTSREAVIGRLLSHADIVLPTLVLFKPDELASILSLSAEAVVKMLDDLSLQAGALHGRPRQSSLAVPSDPDWPNLFLSYTPSHLQPHT
jgi:hypothetical protein